MTGKMRAAVIGGGQEKSSSVWPSEDSMSVRVCVCVF